MKLLVNRMSSEAKLPTKAHHNDAGYDIYSIESANIAPNQRAMIATGIKVAIPDGYVGLIWDRSGLAVKNGIKTMAGVIDAGYRGEIKIALINLGSDTVNLEKHSRIAQLLIQKIENLPIEEVDELSDSIRGEKGFGSSGV